MVSPFGQQLQVSVSKSYGQGHEIVVFSDGKFGIFWSQSSSEDMLRGRVFDQSGKRVTAEENYLWPGDRPVSYLTDYTFSGNADGLGYLLTYSVNEYSYTNLTLYNKFQFPVKTYEYDDGLVDYNRQFDPKHAAIQLHDGSFVLAISRVQNPEDYENWLYEVVYQRFDKDLKPVGDQVQLYSDLPSRPTDIDLKPTSGDGFEVLLLDHEVRPFRPGPTEIVLETGAVVETWVQNGDIWASIDDHSAFRVNATTEGDQINPHIAALGGDRFVISWETRTQPPSSGYSFGLDLDAQIFRATEHTLPDNPLLHRPGLVDGSSPASEVLTGSNGRNTFYFDRGEITGDDRITNFQAHDVLVTNAPLWDSNPGGVIRYGDNDLLDLDGVDEPRDTVKIDNSDRLRLIGEAGDGVFVYARGEVRPFGAKESRLGDNVLTGDASDRKTDMFFLDLNLGLDLGRDAIANFGLKDILVTTSKLYDGNKDGIIQFGAGALLDYRVAKNDSLGQAAISDLEGKAVKALEFDGTVSANGVDYFVYSRVGSPDLNLEYLLG